MVTIEELLRTAKEQNASDVHITVGIPPKMRINGSLVNMSYPCLLPEDTSKIISEFMNKKQQEQLEEKGQVDFSFAIPSLGRYRVSVFKQRGSIAAALRVVGSDIPQPSSLGLPNEAIELYKKNRGLILITGPAGGGKSTTLASIIDMVNENRNLHVITIEDPIEYLHTHKCSMVNQREIGMDASSYSEALTAALREDPDVLFVGELKDPETILLAITAAESGHLVFSTLYTIGAVDTIERIIEVFPTNQQQQVRVQFAAVIRAIVSQQLIPSKDKTKRIPVFEMMFANKEIKTLIKTNQSEKIEDVIKNGKKSGMRRMDDSILLLYARGEITKDSAINFAKDPQLMEKTIELLEQKYKK